jgi:hypothetical protein
LKVRKKKKLINNNVICPLIKFIFYLNKYKYVFICYESTRLNSKEKGGNAKKGYIRRKETKKESEGK